MIFKNLSRTLKVAIPAIGSAGEQSTLNQACLKGGIKFDEVERVYIATPDMFAAMSNKAIDATIVAEPIVSLAAQRGVAQRLLRVDEFYPDQQAAVTTFGAPFVKRRELAEAFMRGYLRGVHDYNDALKDGRIAGKDAGEVVSIIAKYSGFKDENILRNVVPAACHADGMPNMAGLQTDLSFIQGLGLVDKKLTVDQVVDLSFLKNAQQKVGMYSRKG